MKQLKRIKVRKPSFNRRIPTVFMPFELNRHEPMVIKTARTSSAASNKYMILKLFRKQEEIYKEEIFEGNAAVSSNTYRFMPLNDLNLAKGDKAMLKKS